MFSIDQSLSLFIPRVSLNIKKNYIKQKFESLRLGIVDHIDFVQKNKKGFLYKAAYIYFSQWFLSITVEHFQEKVFNPLKQARLIYDDPNFWIVLPNIAIYNKLIRKNANPVISTWTPTSGFHLNSDPRPPFNGKAWLKSLGFSITDNFTLGPKRSTCDTVDPFPIIPQSYIPDESVSLPNNFGAPEDESIDYEMMKTENDILDIPYEKKYRELIIIYQQIENELKNCKEMLEEANYRKENTEIQRRIAMEENAKLQLQLKEQEGELFYTREDNQYLNGALKNMEDELKRLYNDLDEQREDYENTIKELKSK